MTEPLDPITEPHQLADLVESLRGEDRYAIDTEFHRERTYFPKIALLQIAWSGGIVLVDPLAVDLHPLAEVLDGPGVAVVHAASQDLEVLELACGTVPSRLFDTQIAAGFLGLATPSLATLHEHELGIRLPKADRLTDWLRRPLTEDQRSYAASDVAHLLELHTLLSDRLRERGRLGWAEAEFEQLRQRSRSTRDPDEAWRRIKEARHLRGKSVGVARMVAAWRERRAAEIDQPVRFVLPDLAVVGVAQRSPSSTSELRKIRGLEDRHLRNGVADELLGVVESARKAPPTPTKETRRPELARELRPAVGLVSSWVSQLARDLEIETSLLATRSDLEALLRGDEDARLSVGWRADLVGVPIRQLVSGDAALAFDGNGRLALEVRSHQPLPISGTSA
ncbi:MAG: ribonuclease D [Actinomycetota bacterium]|nr:ribonuclease D [Actinomycetota bacterium]